MVFILEKYNNQVVVQDNLSNEEFMALQIWQVRNIFKGENLAIKDLNLDYIAISDQYLDKFELKPTLNVEMERVLCDVRKVCTDEIRVQEQTILKDQMPQDSIFIFKESEREFLTHYIMRKRPLINPSTNDILGIFIIAANFELGFLRKEYLKQLLRFTPPDIKISPQESLTNHQYKIVLCLFMGYHSRKEIAEILSNTTTEEFDAERVQNALKALYRKFECNTPSQLLSLIDASDMLIEFPIGVVAEGHYSV